MIKLELYQLHKKKYLNKFFAFSWNDVFNSTSNSNNLKNIEVVIMARDNENFISFGFKLFKIVLIFNVIIIDVASI